MNWQPPSGKPPRSRWQVGGAVLAVIAAVGGLVILALVVVVFVGLSSWGSNK